MVSCVLVHFQLDLRPCQSRHHHHPSDTPFSLSTRCVLHPCRPPCVSCGTTCTYPCVVRNALTCAYVQVTDCGAGDGNVSSRSCGSPKTTAQMPSVVTAGPGAQLRSRNHSSNKQTRSCVPRPDSSDSERERRIWTQLSTRRR